MFKPDFVEKIIKGKTLFFTIEPNRFCIHLSESVLDEKPTMLADKNKISIEDYLEIFNFCKSEYEKWKIDYNVTRKQLINALSITFQPPTQKNVSAFLRMCSTYRCEIDVQLN